MNWEDVHNLMHKLGETRVCLDSARKHGTIDVDKRQADHAKAIRDAEPIITLLKPGEVICGYCIVLFKINDDTAVIIPEMGYHSIANRWAEENPAPVPTAAEALAETAMEFVAADKFHE